jgi:hypothetical protein
VDTQDPADCATAEFDFPLLSGIDVYCPWLAAPLCSSACPCLVGGLNFDGGVNWLDVALLAERWLEGREQQNGLAEAIDFVAIWTLLRWTY